MFKSIKLKRQNKKLLGENESLFNDVKRMQAVADKRQDEINRLKTEVGNRKAGWEGAEERLLVLRKKLRDQAAADLLLASTKLLFNILYTGKEPPKTELSHYADLQNRLSLMSSSLQQMKHTNASGTYGQGLAGMFGGLGYR